jgi:hypothetical protein
MADEAPDTIDIQELLDRMRTPSSPEEAFDSRNADLAAIVSWRRIYSASILAGLLTEPALHANGIRLDWLQRLVLAKSDGRRKPDAVAFGRALNAGLDRAGVLRLEDPNEDLFCDLIATERGSFRILPGQWEAAGPYTETLLSAFHTLPESQLKHDALDSVYALLTLSDALAERAGVDRFSPSEGEPMGVLLLPNDDTLHRLARRVKFTHGELDRLGIRIEALTPYLLEASYFPYLIDREIGNTPLEFHPLMQLPNAIVVLSPENISIAVRAVLVEAAMTAGLRQRLLLAMMVEQEKYSESSVFWPIPHLMLSAPNRFFMRASVCEFAEGRYLHVIQVPATFNSFPRDGFATVRSLGREAGEFIGQDVTRFWEFLRAQENYQQGITVMLLSGWGAPHSVSPSIDEASAPPGWQYLALSFVDAAVLGACENGKFTDICRILKQVERLEADGFSLHNVNGILNLFGYWRTTGGNLIPEHMSDAEPPLNVMLPIDEILKPRLESARKRDRRALPLPDGGFKCVQRTDWGEEDDLKPVYASLDDAAEGRLLGAVFHRGRTWWIESDPGSGEHRESSYRVWNSTLEWLAAVGADVIDRYPEAFPAVAMKVAITLPQEDPFSIARVLERQAIGVFHTLRAVEGGSRGVAISIDWFAHLWTADNDAEVELVAAILEQLSPSAPAREQLRATILAVIGSRDWRWMHARPVLLPTDRFGATGLVGRFREPKLSAAALMKCGSVWGFRQRSEGLQIEGEEACQSFLALYRNHILDSLIRQIQRFDRHKLVLLATENYQASRLEQSSWRATIRALRAIHGTNANIRAFKRQNAINAVQRAAKVVCEIAGCEAPLLGGRSPGQLDLDEMFANALLLVGNGQLFAAIRSGLIKPTLRISPAGDLLSERAVFNTTLRPAAEWATNKALDESFAIYRRQRSDPPDALPEKAAEWNDDLRRAVEAEYGVPAESFVGLQYAVIDLIQERREPALVIRRKELADILATDKDFANGEPLPLLERLTLPTRKSWRDLSARGLMESDFDLSRFDRPFSLINRPLLALDDDADPLVLVAPLFVSDASMYSLSGLMEGILQGRYWVSQEAVKYAGAQANYEGNKFEEAVAEKLRTMGLQAWPRCDLSWALNEKVDQSLGNIDILAISEDRKRVWIIEAKNLKLCRNEAEVAARLSEYRGRVNLDSRGRERPDKLLRHLRRVSYMRERNAALCQRLKLDSPPEIRGLLIVDSPQPMNFHKLESIADAESAYLDAIQTFRF